MTSLVTIHTPTLVALFISQTLSLSQTIYSNIQKISYFFKMRPDLNFHPTDEKNYTAEKLSGSNFLTGLFSNYGQTDFYPN
jgi:hypothetical protein